MIVIAAATSPDTGSAPPFLAGMLIVLGIVLLALLLSISMRNKISRRQSERATPSEQIAAIKAAARQRGLTQRAAPDSDGTGIAFENARELAAMLDNKAARIELLLEEAEATTNRLETMLAASREPSPEYNRPPAGEQAPSPLDPLTRSVYEMADEGRSAVEIARALDEQTGKIELILALRRA